MCVNSGKDYSRWAHPVSDYKRRATSGVCVRDGKSYSRRTGFECRKGKETMRATLEIALLLLAGYFTLTDGVSKLLHIADCN